MENNREKLQFHNNPYITQMLLLVLFITGLLGMSCKVQCAAAPALRIMKGYGDQALSDYSLCKEFTASDFSQDRIFTNSRRKIYFTGDHFVLSFAHGITASAILEGCSIEPAQVEAIYFGDSLRFTMEELNGEADEVRQNIPEASSIVSYGPGGELTAGEYLVSYWEEDLLALFSDNYDYAIGETMDAYYDSSLIGRKWGDFYYMTQDQNQVETSLRRGLTFYYGQLDPLDVNLPVEGIHTVYIQMKKEVSGEISDGTGSGDSSGGGSSDGNGSGGGSGGGNSGSGSSGNDSSGNNSTGSNSSGSSRTGANNKGSKKTLKNSDGSNNKKVNSGSAGSNKSSSGIGKNSNTKTSDTTTSAAERSAAESSAEEMTDKKENNNSDDTGTDAAGYRKDNSENEDEDPDQNPESEAKEAPSKNTDSPGVLRLKDADSNIEVKAAADMQADSKVLYGTALLVLIGIAAGLVGFRRQMRQSGESGYGRK